MTFDLTLSGHIDEGLAEAVETLVRPRALFRLHAHAMRFGRVLETPDTRPGGACRTAVAVLCGAARVDHAFLPSGAALSDFRLIAMDMDSTLITIECIDELADLAGKRSEVAAITEAAMRGEIADFAESLTRRVALLAGASASLLERVYAERLALSPGAEQLIAAAQAAGLSSLLVSGGFTFFTERLKERLGFSAALANVLDVREGLLTGRVVGGIVDAAGKARAVAETAASIDAAAAETIVIGDGANDLAMMRGAGISVAYHAKPIVRAATTHAIDYGGLDVLLDWFGMFEPGDVDAPML